MQRPTLSKWQRDIGGRNPSHFSRPISGRRACVKTERVDNNPQCARKGTGDGIKGELSSRAIQNTGF